MPSPVSWFRLYRGRVWHVGFAQDAAACGTERPVDAEAVGERAPANARVCGDCVTAALHLYSLAQSAQMGDPRKTFDPWAPVASSQPAVVDTCRRRRGSPSMALSVGALRASMEAARERRLASVPEVEDADWPCGNCGHSSLDHDYDGGSCTVTSDDPAVEWAECPCPTLTPAG